VSSGDLVLVFLGDCLSSGLSPLLVRLISIVYQIIEKKVKDGTVSAFFEELL
jgi:hypothetical protein